MLIHPIEFIPEAAIDYKKLDGSVKKKVDRKLDELSKNPSIGEHLGNKFNVNLTGFYKIYIDNKNYRIVYRIINQDQYAGPILLGGAEVLKYITNNVLRENDLLTTHNESLE